MSVFKILQEARDIIRKRNELKEATSARYDLAEMFNYMYAYTSDPGHWMCPECNKVHKSYENSVLSGLQYPACCSHSAGHRQYKESACMPLNCTRLPRMHNFRVEEPRPMPEPPDIAPFLNDDLYAAAKAGPKNRIVDAYLDVARYIREMRS